jgi:tetratricopeptide (TPR) repeat protein
LIEIGTCLDALYTKNKDMEYLNRAVDIIEMAIEAAPPEVYGLRLALYAKIEELIEQRYKVKQTKEDMDLVIDHLERGIGSPVVLPASFWWFSHLAIWATRQSEHAEHPIEGLNRAVNIYDQALQVEKVNTLEHLCTMSNFSTALIQRFRQSGQETDLHRGVEMAEKAMAYPSDTPGRSSIITCFQAALQMRYEIKGQKNDLVRCIEASEEGLASLHTTSHERLALLNNLSLMLGKQHDLTGSTDDLNKAIEAAQQAVDNAPAQGSSRATYCATLGLLLGRKFSHSGKMEDLNLSIAAKEVGIKALPANDFNRMVQVTNLSASFIHRWGELRNIEDLHRAIEIIDPVLTSMPESYYYRWACLGAHANTHMRLYIHTNEIEHLHQAVKSSILSLKHAPLDHPERPRLCQITGQNSIARHSATGDNADAEQAFRVDMEGWDCEVGVLSYRILCAQGAAYVLGLKLKWQEANILLEKAINLLPVVSPRSLKNEDKQRLLESFAGLASEGAATALNAGREAYDALKLLEVGRGIIGGLLLEMRTDISDLKDDYPALADEFVSLRDDLGGFNIETSVSESVSAWKPDSVRRVEIDKRFNEVIAAIRTLPNFQNFLGPPSEKELQAAADRGPIAVINVTPNRCDAFLIECHQIRVLNLPDLYEEELHAKAVEIRNSGTTLALLQWLWDNIAFPVMEALGFRDVPLAEK